MENTMKYSPIALSLAILLSGSALRAQENLVSQETAAPQTTSQPGPSPFPHPFAYGGAGLMGGGYGPLAATAGGGFMIDTQHFLATAEATYDNGHKTNDNDQPNPNGHDRGLVGDAYYRLSSGWFAGAGARWSQLSTTKYTKSAWRPTFGGGKDYFHKDCAGKDCVADFSMRVSMDYVLPGTDHSNALQGPLFTLYLPSPAAKGHLFFRQTLGIYTFHQTVTDPSNSVLTQQQIGDRSITSFGELTVMYRF